MPRDRSFEALIPTYLAACAAEGKSPRTVAAYGESLHMFVRTAKVEGLPLHAEQVSVPDVYRYLAAVRRRGVSDPTQHRRHREMKHFFSWLKRTEIVTDNPFQKVTLIRLQEPIVRPLEAADVRRLLDALDLQSFVGARDTAITLFLLDTGVRASELTSLNLEDVEFKPGRARVLHAKGKKQRIVAFGDRVALAIQRYLRFRGDLPGSLFLTKQGRRLRPQGLIVTYRRLGERAGVDHVHPHRFRHTFATMAIRAAAREIDVQHLLGHTTSAMVRRYTRTYDSELAAEAHASFSAGITSAVPTAPSVASHRLAVSHTSVVSAARPRCAAPRRASRGWLRVNGLPFPTSPLAAPRSRPAPLVAVSMSISSAQIAPPHLL